MPPTRRDDEHARGASRVRVAMAQAIIALEVVTVAWGALSFGAVYRWGYEPLLIASAAIGVCAFLFFPGVRVGGTRRFAVVFAAIAAFIGVQLAPVAGSTLARWSPVRDRFLAAYDPSYVSGAAASSHAWSLNPSQTLVALGCFAAFSVLLLGTSRLVSIAGPRGLVAGVTGFGLLLALFGIMQNLMFEGQTGEGRTLYIYGFWPDPYFNKPFGPFINKNNFAGWMLMALPLALGYAAGLIAESRRTVPAEWRPRVLWLSTRDGAAAMFATAAALAMGVSVFVSLSRSGILALAGTVLLFGWFMPGTKSRTRVRFARMGVSVVVLLLLIVLVGSSAVTQRFAQGTDATMMGRVITWGDAIRIARDFPVIGTGLNTFRTAMVTYQTGDRANYWSEAHNDYLQLLAEGGIVLALLAIAAIVLIAREIDRRLAAESPGHFGYWVRLGAVGGLAAIGLQELVEFSLQIPGNAALFAALVGIALHRQPPRRHQ